MIKNHPVESVIQIFLDNLDLKEQSIKNYQSVLKSYTHFLKSRNIKEPKRSDVISYRSYLWQKGLESTSVQKHMVVVKGFYKWARLFQKQLGLDVSFQNDIAEGIKGAKIEQVYRKEPLSLEQSKKLLKVASDDLRNIIHLRNYTIILLMIITGMRTIEVSRAKLSDLSVINKESILYIQGKGKDGKDQFVKLPQVLVKAINDYKAKRVDKNKYLFTRHLGYELEEPLSKDYIGRMIKKMFQKAGIYSAKVTPHSLRHTVAYMNLKHGGSLEDTQQLLRHKHIETTLIYAHNIRRLEDKSEYRIANILFNEEKGEEQDGNK
jgi:site-specific recombinase XerD